MKNIYCVVGPSGCGKTTITEALNKKYGYGLIESYTTRPPRYEGETGHIFVSPEEFKALGDMCAYTFFDGHEYGVTQDIIDRNDLYVIDPAGIEFFRKHYHGDKGIQVIGLTAPYEVLYARMKNRGDSSEKIERRLANDAVEFQSLGSITDFLVSSAGSVEDICECLHEFIQYKEREVKTVSLTDEELEDRAGFLEDFFWAQHITMGVNVLDGHLVATDDEGNIWTDEDVYDFALNECLAFNEDGSLSDGLGAAEPYAERLKADAKVYGVEVTSIVKSVEGVIADAQGRCNEAVDDSHIKSAEREIYK